MSTIASQVAANLLKIKAIKLSPSEPFTWASGLKSPIYCDNRITLSHPEIRNFIIQSLKDKMWAFGEFDVIAGVATAGIPHGALLAAACNVLKDAGAKVVGVVAIFTYGFQKAKDVFSEQKIPMDTLTNYRNLLKVALETEYINESEKQLLESWNQDPVAWSENAK